MSGSISGLFNIGPAIAGSILGSAYQHYRPTGTMNPIGSATLIGTLNVWITGDEAGKGTKAPSNSKFWEWFGLFDPTMTQVGDYFVGPRGTFFVMSQDVPQPMRLCRCNHTVSISEAARMTAVGAISAYGGDVRSGELSLAAGWPCSKVQGTKGESGDTKLPSDVKMPWFSFLLPAIPGLNIRNNLILTDESSTRHVTSSAELTPLGWCLSAALATT